MDRRSVRLHAYDYRTAGAYYITVCMHGRALQLARVASGGVVLTALGRIVAQEWARTASARPYVRLDAFVVMPDHVHFVVWIDDGRGMACHAHMEDDPGWAGAGGATREGMARHAPTVRAFGQPPARALSSVVGAFKSACARRINKMRGTPGAAVWQRNFYEHIVRDAADLARIRRYIAENPARWVEKRAVHPFTPPSMRPWM